MLLDEAKHQPAVRHGVVPLTALLAELGPLVELLFGPVATGPPE